MFRFECQCRFRIHIEIDTRCRVSPALLSACTADDCRGRGGRGGAVAAACCRGLLCALWTLMALSCQFAFWLTNDTKWQAANGNWQRLGPRTPYTKTLLLTLPLPLPLPPPSLVIEPEAVNEAQNLKWKRIYPADWPGLLGLLPTRLVSIDFAFWCASIRASDSPSPPPTLSPLSFSLSMPLGYCCCPETFAERD